MFQFQTWTRGALAHFEFLDRQSRNLGSVFDAGLRDLDDCFRNHFREGVVAILDTERTQRLFVCLIMKATSSGAMPWICKCK